MLCIVVDNQVIGLDLYDSTAPRSTYPKSVPGLRVINKHLRIDVWLDDYRKPRGREQGFQFPPNAVDHADWLRTIPKACLQRLRSFALPE